MRDLVDAPDEDVAAERARVAGEGWGARLLALQRPDGQWEGDVPAFTSAADVELWQSLPAERKGTPASIGIAGLGRRRRHRRTAERGRGPVPATGPRQVSALPPGSNQNPAPPHWPVREPLTLFGVRSSVGGGTLPLQLRLPLMVFASTSGAAFSVS